MKSLQILRFLFYSFLFQNHVAGNWLFCVAISLLICNFSTFKYNPSSYCRTCYYLRREDNMVNLQEILYFSHFRNLSISRNWIIYSDHNEQFGNIKIFLNPTKKLNFMMSLRWKHWSQLIRKVKLKNLNNEK